MMKVGFYLLFVLFVASTAHARPLIGLDGLYKFQSPAELTLQSEDLNGLHIVSPEPETLTFSANEPIAMKLQADGLIRIDLLVSAEEAGRIPETIFVLPEQLDNVPLARIGDGDFRDLSERFSADEDIQVAGAGFRRRGRMHYRNAAGGSYYGCVAWVCVSIGGCSGVTGNGVNMTNYLRAKGWHSISCANPPVGAVASWSGGSHGAGHTGRWNGHGWCYDLGCGDPGPKYHLRNCVAR